MRRPRGEKVFFEARLFPPCFNGEIKSPAASDNIVARGQLLQSCAIGELINNQFACTGGMVFFFPVSGSSSFLENCNLRIAMRDEFAPVNVYIRRKIKLGLYEDKLIYRGVVFR